MAAVAALLTLTVAGCRAAPPEQGPSATLAAASPSPAAPTEAPTTPAPTEPADEYAIPADINAAYVEHVMTALAPSIAKATREVVKSREVNRRARRHLAATHRGSALQGAVRAFRDVLDADPTANPFTPRARPPRFRVLQVLSADEDCVFTLVEQDTSGLIQGDVDAFEAFYHLERKGNGDDPTGENPTPWMIAADAEPPGGGREFADPCAA